METMSTQTPDLRTAAQAVIDRWYMVARDGMAMLCADREDAEAEARKADRAYPRNGPHRAVQLVEAQAGARPTPAHIEAMERAWLWMENQADSQSKGGHATFDLMMLREERDALRAAIDAAPTTQPAPKQEAQEPVAGPISRISLREQNDPTAELVRDDRHMWVLYRDGEPIRQLSWFECQFVEAALAAAPTTQPAPQQEAQEPVAGHCRFPGGAWAECSPEHVRMVRANSEEWKGYEVRYLYAEPQPSPAAQGDALDAARYRWLCCKFGETRLPCVLENMLEHGYIADGKPSIDAAIDAARAAQEGK